MAPPTTQHPSGLPPELPPRRPAAVEEFVNTLGDSGLGNSPQRADTEKLLTQIQDLQEKITGLNKENIVLRRTSSEVDAANHELRTQINKLLRLSIDLQEKVDRLSAQEAAARQELNTEQAYALRIAYALSLTGEPVVDGRNKDQGERLKAMSQNFVALNRLLSEPTIGMRCKYEDSDGSFCDKLLERIEVLFNWYKHEKINNPNIVEKLSAIKKDLIVIKEKGNNKKSIFEMSRNDRMLLIQLTETIFKWEQFFAKTILDNSIVLQRALRELQAQIVELEKTQRNGAITEQGLNQEISKLKNMLQMNVERERNINHVHQTRETELLAKTAAQEAALHEIKQQLTSSITIVQTQMVEVKELEEKLAVSNNLNETQAATIAALQSEIAQMKITAAANAQTLQAAKLQFKDAITGAVAGYKSKRSFAARATSIEAALNAIKEIDAAETVENIIEAFQKLYSELDKPVGITGGKSALYQFLQAAKSTLIMDYPQIALTDNTLSSSRSSLKAVV